MSPSAHLSSRSIRRFKSFVAIASLRCPCRCDQSRQKQQGQSFRYPCLSVLVMLASLRLPPMIRSQQITIRVLSSAIVSLPFDEPL